MIHRDGAWSWPVTEHSIKDSTDDVTGHPKFCL
jgi:hypothetical protein